MMCPVLLRCYLCWCILYGHFVISVISGSTDLFSHESISTEKLSPHHSTSFSSFGPENSKTTDIQEFGLSTLGDPFASCEDLRGIGSFNSTCFINSSLYVDYDIQVIGVGNMEILPLVSIVCPMEGCTLSFNLSGSIKVGQDATVVASTVIFSAASLSMEHNSSINTTAMGGSPPSQTSGTPVGYEGAGGGHGGRGASCLKNQTDYWGGDVYSWSNLSYPWAYGSKGGGISEEHKFGGNGGGRVCLEIIDLLYLNGSITAEGGEGGSDGGGGGSGGSIIVHARKLKGFGIISAAGGKGWGGGGGGRISLRCYSKQEDVKVNVHGGVSVGCPWNSGAAGTQFDESVLSLRVDNGNITTETETPLLVFPTSPLWTNVFVENNAIVLVPLLWTRVQVRGQISVICGSRVIFGLSDYPVSEFELIAEELLMSNSVIKVFGALRVSVKMLLMINSQIQVDDGANAAVTTSVLEIRNLVVLTENSIISSNANLELNGQGLLELTGEGNAIKGQRLTLSLFYNITVGPGSLLQAPLNDEDSISKITEPLCESSTCPMELILPPEDCHVNYTLTFSLQICRVEDIVVFGAIKGSIIHIHRARTVIVDSGGMVTASELGCRKGLGWGNYSNVAGGGAGHGGRGGSGIFNGWTGEGGNQYGNADLPCELGSGTQGPNQLYGDVAGGGIIVIGSIQWPVSKLVIYGSVTADGQSCLKSTSNGDGSDLGGLGGGSGGTILLFLQSLSLEGENSSLTVVGGHGGAHGGGGGGGGRVHFHWSNVALGDEYVPLATLNGSISNSGGTGNEDGLDGGDGTVTGKECPKGLYSTFCTECPVGTYKDVEGSDPNLCMPCSLELLPGRAKFVYVRGGVTQSPCPYRCVSDKYRFPNCFTPFEDLIYTFGGPWPFSVLLTCIVVILALLLSTLRIKILGTGYRHHTVNSMGHHNRHHSPYLLSLSEVRGMRAEESQSHVHRMYFMGPNTFREPWHLSYSPPTAIVQIVYEDAFNRFIDEINSVAAYDWWEGSIHSILSVLAYPCTWSWKQWRRRKKIHRLQEYVKSEYDHSCLRSCRSRALYKGMKVGATPDLVVAYIDFFLGGDEKKLDIEASIQNRFPVCIIFGGDGSYMTPYSLHSDVLLTNLLALHVPSTVWNRLVAGLNAQLRTVKHGLISTTLVPVFSWIQSHGNPQLKFHGVRVELGWFQRTASGFYQLGMLVVVGNEPLPEFNYPDLLEKPRGNSRNLTLVGTRLKRPEQTYGSQALSRKRITGANGGLVTEVTLKFLDNRRSFSFPISLLLHNTRPVGHQETVQLLIAIMLLADVSATLLLLLLYYWISLVAFLAVLLILPLSLLSPFPAGLNALFSKGPRRASLARVYALWNATSLSNIVVAFSCGIIRYVISSVKAPEATTWNPREDEKWWLLPTILLVCKAVQARFVDWHIANLEVQDLSLYSQDYDTFWLDENVS